MEREDRMWMYNKNYPECRDLREEFVEGVDRFIAKATTRYKFLREGLIRCPCVKCKCITLLTPEEVKLHLYKKGFINNYFVWTDHEEVNPSADYPIYGTFERKTTDRLKDSLSAARRSGKKPIWSKPNKKWEIPKLQRRSTRGETVRSSETGGSLRSSGSVSTGPHQKRLEKEGGHMTNDELFTAPLPKKEMEGQEIGWVEEHAQRTYTVYKKSEQQWSQSRPYYEDGSSIQPTPDNVKPISLEEVSSHPPPGLASASSFLHNQDEGNSLRNQIEMLEREIKAGNLKLAKLEKIVHKLMCKRRKRRYDSA